MPYKVWAVNEILTAADMNTYVGNQTILSFAGTAERGTAIGTAVEGMLSYVGGGTVEVYAGTATGWTTISGGGGGGVTIGTSAPDSPSDGDLWWDSDDGKLFVYYTDATPDSQWVDAAGPSVAVQSTAPTGYEGQLWLDDTDGSMYVYYTDPGGTASQWIGAVSRSGGILQVVSTTKTDTFSASLAEAAFTEITGLTATITPRSTSSKILAVVSVYGGNSITSRQGSFAVKLQRGATDIALGDTDGSRTSVTAHDFNSVDGDANVATLAFQFLDSPSTTASTTYSVEIGNITNSTSTGTFYVNRAATSNDNQRIARPVSTITLMEVAG